MKAEGDTVPLMGVGSASGLLRSVGAGGRSRVHLAAELGPARHVVHGVLDAVVLGLQVLFSLSPCPFSQEDERTSTKGLESSRPMYRQKNIPFSAHWLALE